LDWDCGGGWEILIFKWFLPLKIQNKFQKTRIWKGKSVEDKGNTWAQGQRPDYSGLERSLPQEEGGGKVTSVGRFGFTRTNLSGYLPTYLPTYLVGWQANMSSESKGVLAKGHGWCGPSGRGDFETRPPNRVCTVHALFTCVMWTKQAT